MSTRPTVSKVVGTCVFQTAPHPLFCSGPPGPNPWLYELLQLVAKGIGQPVVINTSFNTKGKPIINTIKEVIELLKSLPDLVQARLLSPRNFDQNTTSNKT